MKYRVKHLLKHSKSTLLLAVALFCAVGSQSVRAEENGFAATDSPATNPVETSPNLFQMLSERGIRSSFQGKDLTAAWRMLRVENSSGADDILLQMSGRGNGLSSPWSNFYYTRGDVISITGQNYLVGYRVMPSSDRKELQRQQQFLRAWENNSDSFDPGQMPPLEEKTELSLSLLAIGQNTNFSDIRAFDPAKDLLTEEDKSKRSVQIERSVSLSNLKQVALGMAQYAQDYDEMLPPMRAARTVADFSNPNPATAPVQSMLMPYVKSTQIFLHPKTGRPYLPNYKISRMNESAFENTTEVFTFYEDAPDAEGMRNVAFLDGHVKAFSEADFQRLRKAQGISESGFPPAAPPGSKPKVKSKPTPNKRNSGMANRGAPGNAPPPPPN